MSGACKVCGDKAANHLDLPYRHAPRQARTLRIVKTFCCKALVNVCYHNVFRETGALRIPKYLGDDGLFKA